MRRAPSSNPSVARRRARVLRRALRWASGAALLSVGFFGLGPGCSGTPSANQLPSMSSSGRMAFVCMTDPAFGSDAPLPLSACNETRTADRNDYTAPHIYSLVLQPARGEVAVVDLTTGSSDAVLDEDPTVPGANFLPVGAQPVDIVSTPGGVASFVAVAEPGHEGIFGLPSSAIRGGSPRLSSWPACALPSTPGTLVLVRDPADPSGAVRPSCDAAYGAPDSGSCGDGGHCHGDLAADADAAGQKGRYKLVVALPTAGGLAVIDAQAVLDAEAGAYAPCPIERWLPLDANPSVLPDPPSPTPVAGCVNPELDPPLVQSFASQPEAMSLQDGILYVADGGAPVIHRVSVTDPCDPSEAPPLLPRSAEDPRRVVTTTRIAVSPLTIDLRRYLYAVDQIDGSVMVFDVSDDALGRTPLTRSHPERNPFQPPDRVRFQSPPRDVVIVSHQADNADGQTGATAAVRCDPDPASTGPGIAYRTSPGFDSGAAPSKLRGVFALVVLMSGEVVVLDLDDYDAACRGPKDRHALFGCADEVSGLATSGEYSCSTVSAHQTRSSGFLVTAEGIASNQPGVSSFPVLFTSDGSALTPDDDAGKEVPRMRATVVDPQAGSLPPEFTLDVGSRLVNLDPATGTLLTEGNKLDPKGQTLAFNLGDPRAHIVDQGWNIVYEGGLPGFDKRFASLVADDTTHVVHELREPTSRFCARGVHSQEAVRLALAADPSEPDPAGAARDLADYVQVISATPVETDVYWDNAPGQPGCEKATFTNCRNVYGSFEQPREARDFRVLEAHDDRLELEPRHAVSANVPPIKCCFPYRVEFRVRTGKQWIAVGDSVGFLHHVIEDPATGTCRDSCDPNVALLNGRVRDVPQGTAVFDGSSHALENPMVRLSIQRGKSGDEPARDLRFRFTTQGAFHPLVLSFSVPRDQAQPAFATYLSQTGELVMADGGYSGIAFLSLATLAASRQYN